METSRWEYVTVGAHILPPVRQDGFCSGGLMVPLFHVAQRGGVRTLEDAAFIAADILLTGREDGTMAIMTLAVAPTGAVRADDIAARFRLDGGKIVRER